MDDDVRKRFIEAAAGSDPFEGPGEYLAQRAGAGRRHGRTTGAVDEAAMTPQGLGLNHPTPAVGTTHLFPDPNGFWGLSTTSADGQITLLQDLTTEGPLDTDSQRTALALMRQVEDDQSWRVGAVADPSTTPAIKNGWLGLDDDTGRWAVGSVGIATVHGQQVLVAVITQHDVDEASGVASVQHLARAAVHNVVGP